MPDSTPTNASFRPRALATVINLSILIAISFVAETMADDAGAGSREAQTS